MGDTKRFDDGEVYSFGTIREWYDGSPVDDRSLKFPQDRDWRQAQDESSKPFGERGKYGAPRTLELDRRSPSSDSNGQYRGPIVSLFTIVDGSLVSTGFGPYDNLGNVDRANLDEVSYTFAEEVYEQCLSPVNVNPVREDSEGLSVEAKTALIKASKKNGCGPRRERTSNSASSPTSKPSTTSTIPDEDGILDANGDLVK